MTSSSSYREQYRAYLQATGIALHEATEKTLEQVLEQTNWENPQTALDWNNLAVATLIEAEFVDNLGSRSIRLNKALEALNQGINLGNHPLPFAHLAILKLLLESRNQQGKFTNLFPTFINLLINGFHTKKNVGIGLIYLLFDFRKIITQERVALQIVDILNADNGYTQALKLLSESLYHSFYAFYSTPALRLLNLAAQLSPDSAVTQLKLGISNLTNNCQEGLLNLHRAQALAPHFAAARQALYLAYRDMGIPHLAKVWLQADVMQYETAPIALSWRWTELAIDAPVTYVPFEESLLMAVEPSLRSIVTKVLIAEGDWFESEMEFWRYWLKPGMTVIDVGANAGVYTFSAAKRVGPDGRVFAIEPFSRCVQYLEVTKQLNQLDWVRIYKAAASNHRGTVRLSLASASELNKVMMEDNQQTTESFEEVTALPLDDLIEQEQLSRVDWLKIDAEGHEMQVLQGSDRLLTEFMPAIMYENLGYQVANLPVAEYLKAKGYRLFCYQPYLRQLIPIKSMSELTGILNIIALPSQKLNDFKLSQ